MSDAPELLYLEPDDEVTSVVRRVRASDAERVVLVAPGRSRATSSVVALRLLGRVGEETGRGMAVVGDALTRSLATEAGIDAYSSVDDARAALPVPIREGQPRRASIHVVRGAALDETAPVAAAPRERDMALDETRPVGTVALIPRTRRARRPRRALPLAALLALVGLLLAAAAVVGLTVLPAATIEVTPRSEPVGPVNYEIAVDDAQRIDGNVTSTATVTATGTYAIQAAATGTVTFRNFNPSPVEIPAGTPVAAGDAVFASSATVVAPPGSLTGAGTIAGGEVVVGVAAQLMGDVGNVPAEAIDTILDEQVRNRLRGFPQNNARLVLNPEATAGGIDTTGPEITQADVDAAVASLLQALDAAVVEALAATGDRPYADPLEPPQAVVEGADGLAGQRDVRSAEISGSLAYDRLVADPDEVTELAEERFATDSDVLPPGHELLPGATRVTVGDARRAGDRLVVGATVRGASAPRLDRDAILERVRGRPVAEAEAALDEFGDATVSVWPGWVAEVPELDWRLDVRLGGTPPVALPSASASGPP